ncbi:MAG: histidine kinase [Gemmatimonadota bacterium]
MTSPIPSAGIEDAGGEPLEGELARFFSYSHDVLTILDGRGRILMVSPSVQRTLGYRVGDVEGGHFLRWVFPEDRRLMKKRLRTLRGGHSLSDLDARVLNVDGHPVPMRWSVSLGSDGRVYAVGRDRTDQLRRREALLRQELAELRLRTALELHDGILQTLTGTSLQIAVARRLIGTDPAAAGEVLQALGESVASEQREMRLYVDEVKGPPPAWRDGTLGLAERIESIIERVGAIWGVTTSVDLHLPDTVPPELGRQVLRIIQEATVNAVRHGSATEVSLSVAPEGADIALTIMDNGVGFSFLGEFDDKTLKEKRLGPLSLKHRVQAVGGNLWINSTTAGSKVVVRLPLFSEAAE